MHSIRVPNLSSDEGMKGGRHHPPPPLRSLNSGQFSSSARLINQIILEQNVVKDVYCNHGVFPNLKNIVLQLYTLNNGTPLLGNLHVHEF